MARHFIDKDGRYIGAFEAAPVAPEAVNFMSAKAAASAAIEAETTAAAKGVAKQYADAAKAAAAVDADAAKAQALADKAVEAAKAAVDDAMEAARPAGEAYAAAERAAVDAQAAYAFALQDVAKASDEDRAALVEEAKRLKSLADKAEDELRLAREAMLKAEAPVDTFRAAVAAAERAAADAFATVVSTRHAADEAAASAEAAKSVADQRAAADKWYADTVPKGAREVPIAPADGTQIWNGTIWDSGIVPPEQIDAERDRRIFGGFYYDGVLYQSREFDQQNISGAALSASMAVAAGAQPGNLRWHGGPDDFKWIAADNHEEPMDAQTVIAFGRALMQHRQAHIFAGRALKSANPTPADFADDRHWP